jgi:hypothetical protein
MVENIAEITERYVILLLGVEDRPVPTIWHLQKELFILSNINPKTQKFFNFEKHYNGPFSQIIQEIIENPLTNEDTFAIDKQGFYLTESGKKIYKSILEQNKNEKFLQLLNNLKIIRNTYDKLNVKELLLLFYLTYPEFTEDSNISKNLLSKKKQILHKLLQKGVISKDKLLSLLNEQKRGENNGKTKNQNKQRHAN